MESLQMVWLAIVFFRRTVVCTACMNKYCVWDSLDSGVAVLVIVIVAVVNVAVDMVEEAPTEGPVERGDEGYRYKGQGLNW